MYNIESIFKNHSDKEIQRMFSKAQLQAMYLQVFVINPTSRKSKAEIVGILRQRQHNLEQAEKILNLTHNY